MGRVDQLDQLFLERVLDRLLVRSEFQRPFLRERLTDWFGSKGTAVGPDDNIKPEYEDKREH